MNIYPDRQYKAPADNRKPQKDNTKPQHTIQCPEKTTQSSEKTVQRHDILDTDPKIFNTHLKYLTRAATNKKLTQNIKYPILKTTTIIQKVSLLLKGH